LSTQDAAAKLNNLSHIPECRSGSDKLKSLSMTGRSQLRPDAPHQTVRDSSTGSDYRRRRPVEFVRMDSEHLEVKKLAEGESNEEKFTYVAFDDEPAQVYR
jgi:hypothetical protein